MKTDNLKWKIFFFLKAGNSCSKNCSFLHCFEHYILPRLSHLSCRIAKRRQTWRKCCPQTKKNKTELLLVVYIEIACTIPTPERHTSIAYIPHACTHTHQSRIYNTTCVHMQQNSYIHTVPAHPYIIYAHTYAECLYTCHICTHVVHVCTHVRKQFLCAHTFGGKYYETWLLDRTERLSV